jgi:hypothetical protein
MMIKPSKYVGCVLSAAQLYLGVAGAHAQSQFPIMDRVADKVVQKYQTSSCQQLAAERKKPKSGKKEEIEERVVGMLRQDAEMRKAFLDKVAAPIANKLLECGLIP